MAEGFVSRELDRIQAAIIANHPERDRLMVAQQALIWSLDPNSCYASPFAMVTGIQDPGAFSDTNALQQGIPQ